MIIQPYSPVKHTVHVVTLLTSYRLLAKEKFLLCHLSVALLVDDTKTLVDISIYYVEA